MADRFSIDEVLLGDVYPQASDITPSNTEDLPQVSRALYIGTSGDLKVRMTGYSNEPGNIVTFQNVPVGVFKIRVSRVYESETTASGIIALY